MKPTPFDPASLQSGAAAPAAPDRPQTGEVVAPIPGGHTAPPPPRKGVTPIPTRAFDKALVRNIIYGVLHLLAFQISNANKQITLVNLKREIDMFAAQNPSEMEAFYTLYTKPFGHVPVSVIASMLPRIGAKRRNVRSDAEIAPLVLDFMTKLAAAISRNDDIDALLAAL